MSFLAPLFLIGTLAVALPILFHLIRRTTRERMPFSTLMFLQPSPPRVTRRSRLENLLLLALRCLALCLLGLGFARPFVQKPMDPALQSEQARKVVVLVDTSASMKREGLWPAALAKAESVLKSVEPVETAALFAFDRDFRALMNLDDWPRIDAAARAGEAIERLRATQPGWAATRLDHGLIGAAEALEDADKNAKLRGPRQIVVITDLQEGAVTEALQGYEWPKEIDVVIEPLRAKRPTNAGVQLLDAADAGDASATSGARLRVFNATDSKREQFVLRWDGAPTNASVEIYVPPGQSRVVFAPKMPEGLAAGQVVLSGDDEDFDNRAFVVPPRVEAVPVIYLGNEGEADTAQPLYFLKRAFQNSARQTVQIFSRKPDEAAAALLAATNAPLLIFSDPVADTAALRRFAEGGRTVLAVVKNAAVAETVGRLAGIEGFAATEAAVRDYAMLARIDFQHPLFAPFADPRFSDFTKIHFWKHRRLAIEKLPGAKAIAEFDGGDAALAQFAVGRGSVLVLACGWHPGDSQLALSSKFLPLLYAMLEAGGALRTHAVQHIVGDRVSLPENLFGGASPVTVKRPDGSVTNVLSATNFFTQTDLPGIYTASGNGRAWSFAVNVAAQESRTAPMPVEDLERLGVPVRQWVKTAGPADEQKRRQLAANELEGRQKLWRWLLVIALVVLLAESWLAGRTQRASVAQA